jgi:hypothetical protein
MEYPQLRVGVGDEITLTTIQGQTVTGKVVEIETEPVEGRVRALAIQDDPSRDDPVWIRGDLIALWRLGAAVQVPMVGQNGIQPVPLSPEMLRHLRQQ